jgi:hypothetical protein
VTTTTPQEGIAALLHPRHVDFLTEPDGNVTVWVSSAVAPVYIINLEGTAGATDGGEFCLTHEGLDEGIVKAIASEHGATWIVTARPSSGIEGPWLFYPMRPEGSLLETVVGIERTFDALSMAGGVCKLTNGEEMI